MRALMWAPITPISVIGIRHVVARCDCVLTASPVKCGPAASFWAVSSLRHWHNERGVLDHIVIEDRLR